MEDEDERLTDMLREVLGGGCFLLDQYRDGVEYFTSNRQMTTVFKSSSTPTIVKKVSNYVCRRNVSKIWCGGRTGANRNLMRKEGAQRCRSLTREVSVG